MKTVFPLLLTFVLAPILTSSAAKTDSDGHTLIKLWQEFSKAESSDSPKTAASALEKIKSEARKAHLVWDYYDACEKYVSVRSRSNWKLRDSLQKAFRSEIEVFGEPSAVYYMRRGEDPETLAGYLRDNEKALKAGAHREFWKRDWKLGQYKFSDALMPLLASDWDWCLWSLENEAMLQKESSSYPLKAFAEYRAIKWGEQRKAELEAYAIRYEGKAAALLAKEDLLQMHFDSLQGWGDSAKEGKSEDFKALRSRCDALTREAAAMKGEEGKIAMCCKQAGQLIETLDSKSLGFSISDSRIDLTLRNLGSVKIFIYKDKEKLWEFLLGNPLKSYYALDKLQTPLPQDLPDGSYRVKCVSGKEESEGNWEKYSISLAQRTNSEGTGIWAADFRSGKPLDKADLEILRDSEVQKTFKGISLKGFTSLPPEAERMLATRDRHSWGMRVRSGKRASQVIGAGWYGAPDLSDDPQQKQCIILTDRSAFKPGETVYFKAIVYKGKYSLAACAGQRIAVVLRDASGDVAQQQEFICGENGSSAGEFILQRRARNGRFRIEVSADGKFLGSKNILVDDFVLPTFDLVFDELPRLSLPLESITVKGTVKAYSGHSLAGADISYRVSHDGKDDWASGKIYPEKDRFAITFPADGDAENTRWGSSYAVSIKVTDVTGETIEFQKWIHVQGRSEVPVPKKEFFFEDLEDGLGVRIVAGMAETWAVAEVYGTGNVLLDKKLLHFAPSQGAPAETEASWKYLPSWPESVRLNVIYFQDKKTFKHTLSRERENHTLDMPLKFERFLDTTAPGAEYTFTIKTGAGAEVAATVFDKSSERFMPNRWTSVKGRNRPGPTVSIDAVSGIDNGGVFRHIMYKTAALTRSSANVALASMDMDDAAPEAVEEAALQTGGAAQAEGEEAIIREDFASTAAWEPFLKADGDGTLRFTFRNSDKLSTFYVQLFSHDAAMHNEAVRKEMTVTLPVKVNLVETAYLYEGDEWTVRAGLSSSRAGDIAGTLKVSFLDGENWKTARELSSQQIRTVVPGGGSCSAGFRVAAPSGTGHLGIKLSFVPDRTDLGSDAVFVSIPLKKAEQTLSEAHSAVLLSGMDRSEIEASLRNAFVNMDGAAASLREISILDMIKEAVPEELVIRDDNAISLSKALYAWHLCRKLGIGEVRFDRDGAVSKLLALRCEDGGFAWMRGMDSSPIVTALVLQRLHGLSIIDEKAAVKYLDKAYFNQDSRRWWYCGLSLGQYLYTRSLFPEVPLEQKVSKDFRKQARAYLVPSRERGLSGQVLSKARRLLTLDNLLSSQQGLALARKAGICIGASRRLRKSVEADVRSLAQYAERHAHGGVYYPNAVMPWRGLLESELYAHSLLCNLMARHSQEEIADGVRLWIMLQKETQHWESDSGYIEAIASVMEASQEVLDTKVLALSGTYSKPFSDIAASGNGMKISVLPAVDAGSGEAAAENLKIGDRIRISWRLGSEENRSFVKVTLPHCAGLQPVNQLSGYNYRCYRNVLPDRVELWYEAYPEESITVSEEYYVTRAGSFQAPVAEIECEYAPHYRANDSWHGRQTIADE